MSLGRAPRPMAIARFARGRLRVVLVIAALTGRVAGLAAADYPDDFIAGIRALDQKRWTEAIERFRAAERARPDTGERVRVYGLRYENYLPQFFLGKALYGRGDWQEALNAFNASERIGFVKNAPALYRELQQSRTAAQSKIQFAAVPPATTTIPSPPSSPAKPIAAPPPDERAAAVPATGPGTPATKGPGDLPAPPIPAPAAPVVPPATATLTNTAPLAPPKPTTPNVTPPLATPAATARVNFDRLLGDATRASAAGRLADARFSANQARELGVDTKRIDDLLKAIDVQDLTAQLNVQITSRQWPAAQALVARVAGLDPLNVAVREGRQRIARGIADDGERGGLGAFYRGQYQQALEIFNGVPTDARTPRTVFYMACSNAALALLDGPKGQVRLQAARDLYRGAQPNQGGFAVDRRYISPRILRALEGSN